MIDLHLVRSALEITSETISSSPATISEISFLEILAIAASSPAISTSSLEAQALAESRSLTALEATKTPEITS